MPAFYPNLTVLTTLRINTLYVPKEPTQAPSQKCAHVQQLKLAKASDFARQTKANVLTFAKPSQVPTCSTLPCSAFSTAQEMEGFSACTYPL